jgi:phosphohistidine phosphatase
MQLILVRHGQAEAMKTTDESRELTALGRQQAAWTAQQVMALYQPDLFVVSPLVRAQQTRHAFTTYCPDVPVLTFDGIKPDDEAKPAIDWLGRQHGECIVVVCHMNVVAYMAGLLLGEHPEPFHLAEARVFEQAFISTALSVEKNRFVPNLQQ